MSERTFDHFPKDATCPICKTNDDKPCFLVRIPETSDGDICEAQPFHVDCLTTGLDKYVYEKRVDLLWRILD